MSKVVFNNTNNEFYQSLKASVDEYFAEKKIKKTGDWRLFSKTIILVSAAVTMYALLMFAAPITWVALLLCAGLGFALASIGFSVMHDANHGSYSPNTKLNDLLGLSLNAMAPVLFYGSKNIISFIILIPMLMVLMMILPKAPSSASANHKNGCRRIKSNIFTCYLFILCLLFFGYS